MTRRLKFIIISIIFGLAACNGQAPTVAPFPTTPTKALTSTPTATNTPSPEPSATNVPLVSTPVNPLTHDEIVNAIKQQDLGKLCGGRSFSPVMDQSPNNQWISIPCHPHTQITKIDGTQTWIVSMDALAFPDDLSRDNSNLTVRKWSKDGKYLYLSLSTCCPDRLNGLAFYDHALYRLDLTSGQFLTLIELSRSYYAYSLSPDEQTMVYSKPGVGDEIFIQDLESKAEWQVLLDRNYGIGDFLWNSDGSEVFFAGEIEGWPNGSNGFSLLALNLKNKSASVLIDNDLRLFVPIGLLGKNKLLLESNKSDVTIGEKYWAFNIITKQLALGPTPTPYAFP